MLLTHLLIYVVKSAARLATCNPSRLPAADRIPMTREILLLIAEKRRLRLRRTMESYARNQKRLRREGATDG